MNYKNKLDKYYIQIKDIPKLKLEDAKKIYNEMLTKEGVEKEELRNKLISGTLYLILNYVKSINLEIIECYKYDLDDYISSITEQWIRMIDDGILNKINSYNKVFDRVISYNSNKFDEESSSFRKDFFDGLINVLDFSKILELYLNDLDNGININYNRLKEYLVLSRVNYKESQLEHLIGRLYDVLEGIRDNINLDEYKSLSQRICLIYQVYLFDIVYNDKSINMKQISQPEESAIFEKYYNDLYQDIIKYINESKNYSENEKKYLDLLFIVDKKYRANALNEISLREGKSKTYYYQLLKGLREKISQDKKVLKKIKQVK